MAVTAWCAPHRLTAGSKLVSVLMTLTPERHVHSQTPSIGGSGLSCAQLCVAVITPEVSSLSGGKVGLGSQSQGSQSLSWFCCSGLCWS